MNGIYKLIITDVYDQEKVVKILFWFVCSALILLMILSCREQDNLLGDVSGDTSLIMFTSLGKL